MSYKYQPAHRRNQHTGKAKSHRSHDHAPKPLNIQRALGNSGTQRDARMRLSNGNPLPVKERSFFEQRLNRNLSHVRIHNDHQAHLTASAYNARAMTLGPDIVFSQGAYSPDTIGGQRLLAHELTHVAQQGFAQNQIAGQLHPLQPSGIQRAIEQEAVSAADALVGGEQVQLDQRLPSDVPAFSLDDPDRFETVYQNLFVDAPGVGTTARQPWQPTTEDTIVQQFKTAMQAYIDDNPRAVMGTLPHNTTETSAEATAIQVDQEIRTRFPQIGSPLPEQQLRDSVSLMTTSQTSDPDFIAQWLANRLYRVTNIGDYTVDEDDANFQQVVNRLATDQTPFDFTAAFSKLASDLAADGETYYTISYVVQHERRRVQGFTWARVIQVLASRTGAFVESGHIHLSRGLSASRRRLTLIHELTHFYTHPGFKEWVKTTTAPRFYNEGFTEYLARRIMSPAERNSRTNYQNRVDAVEQEVAPYVSLEDIASAYFAGEVWRLETRSDVARRLFGEQTGLHAGVSRDTERAESATSTGIVQTVVAGERYRFMNLAVAGDQIKPEHEAALRQILTQYVLNNSSARIRFVGHASSPGPSDYNLRLSRRRAAAFYALARQLGVPESQLIDTDTPRGEGESHLNVTEQDRVIERALNRRVELFIE